MKVHSFKDAHYLWCAIEHLPSEDIEYYATIFRYNTLIKCICMHIDIYVKSGILPMVSVVSIYLVVSGAAYAKQIEDNKVGYATSWKSIFRTFRYFIGFIDQRHINPRWLNLDLAWNVILLTTQGTIITS